MRYKTYLFPLLLILSFLIGCGVSADNQSEQKAKNPGQFKSAPDFRLKSFSGKWLRLSDFRGKVIILDFWATWCPPCVKEIPHFVELSHKYSDQGLVILGISLDRGGERVLSGFINKYKVNYPILIADGKIDKVYGGIQGIPTTFIIDRAGNIRQKYIGFRPKSVFEREITKLLQDK